MADEQWTTSKFKQFERDMQVLCDTYGIRSLRDMYCGYQSGKFRVGYAYAVFRTGNENDAVVAEDIAKRALIDRALDNGDRNEFDRLVGRVQTLPIKRIHKCGECGTELVNEECRCDGCGRYICVDCYNKNERCVICELEQEGTFDGIN